MSRRVVVDARPRGVVVATTVSGGADGDGSQRARASDFGRVVLGLGYLIRRDANVTGISIILIAGLPRLAAALLVIAFTAVFVLALVHFAVTARRARRER